jgi:hypothetical protein
MAHKHVFVKFITALVLLFTCMMNSGCSGDPIHAQSPSFSPPHQELVCPRGCIAFQSAPNFLELRFGPTSNTDQDGFTTALPFPMTVKLLDVWIGTQSGAVFESDSRLQIVLPDGTFYEFKAQYDKHQDVVGDVQRSFPVNLSLPAGTMLTLYHSQQGVISCPQGCGFDTTWSFVNY